MKYLKQAISLGGGRSFVSLLLLSAPLLSTELKLRRAGLEKVSGRLVATLSIDAVYIIYYWLFIKRIIFTD